MNFFVFSLPRSGSAWLSVFLTGKDSFCYHELTAEKEWREVPKRRREVVVGAIDTAASMYSKAIYEVFPKAKYFTLVRDCNEINKSVKKLAMEINIVDSYDAFKFHLPKHDIIRYDMLSDIGYLKDIWAQIVGTEFDKERAELLIQMNVQRDVKKLVDKLKAA